MMKSNKLYSVILLLSLVFICLQCEGERAALHDLDYHNTSIGTSIEVVTIRNLDDMEAFLERFGYDQEEIHKMKEEFQKQIDAFKKLQGYGSEEDEEEEDEEEEDFDFAEQMRKVSASRKAKAHLSPPSSHLSPNANQQNSNKPNGVSNENNNNNNNNNNNKLNNNKHTQNINNNNNNHIGSQTQDPKAPHHSSSSFHPSSPPRPPLRPPSPPPHPSSSSASNNLFHPSPHKQASHSNANSDNLPKSSNFLDSNSKSNSVDLATCQNRKSSCTKCSTLSKQCQSDEVLLSGGCHASSALSGNFQSNFGEMYGIGTNGGQSALQWFCMTEREAEFITVYVNCCKNNM